MIFALLIPIIILLLFGIISSAKPKPSDYFPHQTMNKHFKGDLENDEFNVKEYYGRGVGLVKIVINNYLVNELVELEIIDN